MAVIAEVWVSLDGEGRAALLNESVSATCWVNLSASTEEQDDEQGHSAGGNDDEARRGRVERAEMSVLLGRCDVSSRSTPTTVRPTESRTPYRSWASGYASVDSFPVLVDMRRILGLAD
jgi:hypothetical protein